MYVFLKDNSRIFYVRGWFCAKLSQREWQMLMDNTLSSDIAISVTCQTESKRSGQESIQVKNSSCESMRQRNFLLQKVFKASQGLDPAQIQLYSEISEGFL
ncbi:hypothetical protein ABPG72_012582 [Tetrahymena utriculariae]